MEQFISEKNALVAVGTLNDQVLPFFEEQEVPLLRILTDRGTEYCGKREHHEYQLYLALVDIDHSKTKTRRTKGMCRCNNIEIVNFMTLNLALPQRE